MNIPKVTISFANLQENMRTLQINLQKDKLQWKYFIANQLLQ